MQVERVCIVGLGLMGGSLALALRPFLSHLIIVDTNDATRKVAQKFTDEVTGDLTDGVREAELVILATPVRTILHLLAQLPVARPDGCMIMDLGSTKAEICRTMEALPESFQAIGGHPMCGKETAGFAAASADLYRGQTFVLCRNGRTTPKIEAVAHEIIEIIGANPLRLSSQIHDEMVATTSHLPYLVSAALMNTAAAQNNEQLWQVSASGFHDTTRLAGSAPQMLLDILLTNETAILNQIEAYQSKLNEIKHLLLNGSEQNIADWLKATSQHHADYKNVKRKM